MPDEIPTADFFLACAISHGRLDLSPFFLHLRDLISGPSPSFLRFVSLLRRRRGKALHLLDASITAVEDPLPVGSTRSVGSPGEHRLPMDLAESKELVASSGVPQGKAVQEVDCSRADDFRAGGCTTIEDLPSALISEILRCLDAKELGVVSCVSTLLNDLASDHQGWKSFYCDRWGPHPTTTHLHPSLPKDRSWKELFVEREFRASVFMGRYSMDVLHGHTEAVRTVFILKSAKLIFTGGYDSILRMWSLEDGLCIASSRPLGCTIRAITADTELLVGGGTDAFLQCWKAIEGCPHHFGISEFISSRSSEFRLWGHEGPVTCIALDSNRIFSGSWDTSIRIWDRKLLNCINVLWHGDWVWALVPRGSTIASTAGRDAYVWDIQSGELVNAILSVHAGNAHSLARTYAGDILFVGGEDGAIHMFKINRFQPHNDIKLVATWIPHNGPVTSLAFEFPWLVSSSNDGRLALIDIRKLLRSNRCFPSKCSSITHKQANASTIETPQRMLHGFGCNLYSVDIGADRIVCGGEEGIVRVWDFSQALEIEKRVQALKRVRLENRMRRRNVQIEMKSKCGRDDRCHISAKRNHVNGDRTGVWHSKRSVAGKLKS